MLDLTASQIALALLVPITPICLWVIYTDLKYMKIRNTAVLALLAVYAVVGFLTLPFGDYAWRWLHVPVVLGVGLLLNAIMNFGMGDAKFAAAAAPFFAYNAPTMMLMVMLLTAFLLGTFTAHRVFRAIPKVRALTPDWVSWTRADFPMGLALVGTLWTYLLFIVITG